MSEDFILWRCLHNGPLSKETIDELPKETREEWETHRATNVPLLTKIIKTYGTCAILARDGGQIVGFLRFYPKILYSMEDAGALCLQQAFPAGPSRCLGKKDFHLWRRSRTRVEGSLYDDGARPECRKTSLKTRQITPAGTNVKSASSFAFTV